MNDKHKARLKKFGDKLARDEDVTAHMITVWYANGDVENNWSGVNTPRPAEPPALSVLSMDDAPDE